MKIEIILLLVIGLIFLTDTIMRGIKKKTSSSEIDIKIENPQDFKNTDNTPPQKKWNNLEVLKYIFDRKKNISLVLIIIPFLKVILHYVFYPMTDRQFLGYASKKDYSWSETYTPKYGSPYRVSFGEHLNFTFDYDSASLFIPSIIIVLFIAWYFNDKIKAK
jgi:hypothetical protein